jgi:hypothetical protein
LTEAIARATIHLRIQLGGNQMTTRRKCERCQGEEFLMTTTSGVVISWHNASGERGTWFCPNCDWGERKSDRRA